MEKAKKLARATVAVSGGSPKSLERSRVILSRLNGVNAVGVNYLTDMVSIEYDYGRISLEKIRTVLKHRPR